MISGIQPTPKDPRRYSLHRTFGGVSMNNITDFNLDAGLTNPSQDADGFPEGCSGYTQAEICQDMDKIQYLPRYTYDKTLEIEGINPGDNTFEKVGVTVEDSLKSTIVYGVQDTTGADPLTHRRGSYFDAFNGSGLDCFNSAISAMKTSGRSLSIGAQWQPAWLVAPQGFITGSFVPDPNAPWHNFKVCGLKTINGVQYLIAKPWIGPTYGDHGFCYFSRDIFNRMMNADGTVAFVLAAYTGDVQTVKLTIREVLVGYLQRLLAMYKSTPMPSVTAPVPVLLWDNPEDVRHSVRVMCDNAGMTESHQYDPVVTDKNILCACVEQESRFNTKATHPNLDAEGRVSSTDWGVCQINDYFNIGEGKPFPSVDYVLNNPEACVAWMIKMFQTGEAKLWSSFTSGAYKQWL